MKPQLVFRCGLAFTLSCGTVAGAAWAADVADPDTRALAARCTTCHGDRGRSAGDTPVLAGLPVYYFIKQMHDFKSGDRPATVMQRQAQPLTDAEIERLAEYFAAQKRHRRIPEKARR